MAKSVAEKNDVLRSTMIGCKVILTQGITQSANKEAIIGAVRAFDQFHDGNDPYGEHDFAFFEINGQRCFFKFDYYDSTFQFFEEDGHRVLTIGLADEY